VQALSACTCCKPWLVGVEVAPPPTPSHKGTEWFTSK
jgi:hypothetical protein